MTLASPSFLRTSLFLFLFTLESYFGLAQHPTIDSLQLVIAKTDKKQKADALNKLAYEWFLRDYAKCKQTAEEALRYSEEISYPKGKVEAGIYLGIYEAQITGDYKTSQGLLAKAAFEAHEIGAKDLEGFSNTQIGNLYRNSGKLDSAWLYYQKSFTLLRDSLNPWHLSMLYRNMGKYYGLTYEPSAELTYYKKAWQIREKLTDHAMQVDALVCLSSWYSRQYDFREANLLLNQAEPLSEKIGPSWVTSDYYAQKAALAFQLGDSKSALIWYSKGKDYYSKNSIPSYVKLLVQIGSVMELTGNFEVSQRFFFDALRLAEQNQLIKDKVKILLSIGRSYHNLKKEKLAEEYARASEKIAIDLHYKFDEAEALNLIGNIYTNLDRFEDSKREHTKALQIRQELGDKKGISASLYNLGEVAEYTGHLREGLSLQLQSLNLDESMQDYNGLCISYSGLGRLYLKLGDLDKCSFYLNKGEALAKQIQSGSSLVDVYFIRRNLLERQGKIKEALNYSKLYENLKDSVFTKAQENNSTSLEGFYELQQKEKEIELLNQSKVVQQNEILLQRSQIRQQRITILGTIVALILLAALAFMLFKYYKKKNKLNQELQERSEEIQTQSEELSKTNKSLIELNRALAEKQEEIQAQSEELTEANESLTLLNKDLAEKTEELAAQSEELTESNQIISNLNQSLEQKVSERTEQLQQAYKELDTFFYRSSHDFRRPLTTFMGLAEVAYITVTDSNALNLFEKVKETAVNLDRMLTKLQSISEVASSQFVVTSVSIKSIFEDACSTYSQELSNEKIKVDIHVSVSRAIISMPVFLRIIVENLLENSIRFKNPVNPMISLEALEAEGGVEITVRDNGIGIEDIYKDRVFEMFFRGSQHSKGNGLGLYIVKKAVEKLKGKVIFNSTYLKGTTVAIWLPFQLSHPEYSPIVK